MTDTPLDLDLDAIEARAAVAAFPDDSTAATFEAFTLARNDVPALIAALRKANAQVAAVLALCDEWEAGPWSWLKDTAAPRVRAAVDGANACACAMWGHAWRNDGAIPLVCDTCGHVEAGR